MLAMDLKSKGITWVGNVFQKFETMCLEVEDIMCQETTKYVENQVQTVGVTVKKFYAEVVQDLLPTSFVDPVKGARLDSFLDQNADVKTHQMPNADIEEDPIEGKLPPSQELEVIAPVGKDSSHSASVNHLKEESSDSSIEQNDVIGMSKKPKVAIHEDSIVEKLPSPEMSKIIAHAEKDLSKASLSSRFSNENIEKACETLAKISPLASVEVEPRSPEMLEIIAPAGKVLSEASLSSRFSNENIEKACDTLTKISPPTSVDVIGCNSSQNTGQIHNNLLEECAANISGNLPYSNLVLPVFSSEKAVTEVGMTPCISLPIGSNGADSTTYKPLSLIESSKNGHKQANECSELEDVICSPEIGRPNDYDAELAKGNDAIVPDMDTIKAFDSVKLDDSCIVVDCKECSSIPHWTGKHRSYKKKIRDAFTSKTRSAKQQEYEQLAFWYGDIDTLFDQKRVESSTLSTFSRDLVSKKQPGHEFCESDWELL